MQNHSENGRLGKFVATVTAIKLTSHKSIFVIHTIHLLNNRIDIESFELTNRYNTLIQVNNQTTL